MQFWDEPHLVARYIRDLPNQPQPDCCDRSGILWDLAAVYPPGSQWTTSPPPAVFVNGAVVQVQPALTQAILRSLPPNTHHP